MPVPLIVALGRAVPLSHSVTVQQELSQFSEGQLELRTDWTPARLFWPANRKRKSITIIVPAGGKDVWVGGDNSVIKEWGACLPAGQSFKITAYYGPIWIISDGLQKVFVVET